jgi:hypothetical protein
MQNDPPKKSISGVVFLVLVLPFLLWQCDQHEKIMGKYHAVDVSSHGRLTATLELHANGKGLWSIETDNADFRWDLKRNKIRLHTQSGGIIEGIVDNGTIQIALPGMGVISFKHDPSVAQ